MKRSLTIRCGSYAVHHVELTRQSHMLGARVDVRGQSIGRVTPSRRESKRGEWAASRLDAAGYTDPSTYHPSALAATKALVCRVIKRRR